MLNYDIIARISPAHFAYYSSDGRWQPAQHLLYLNKKLIEVAIGKSKRLIVNMPPRHGKSELISKYFPAWYLSLFPENRIILTSYEYSFASSWGRKTRDLIRQNNDISQVEIHPDNSAIDNFSLLNGGGMSCAGAGGPITGKGCDLLIIDDPIKNDAEAQSITYRNKLEEWFYSTAYTRLEPDGSIVLIMTRWHEDDLCGRILEKNTEKWEVIKLPAFSGTNCPLNRKKGEPLWKERFSWQSLNNIKNSIGSYWFSALYQQEPSPSGSGIFNGRYFKYFDENNDFFLLRNLELKSIPKSNCRIYVTVDLAVSISEKSDYTCAAVFAITNENDILLLDIIRKRIEGADHVGFIQLIYEKYRPLLIGIEAVQYQISLVQTLLNKGLPVKRLRADKDKLSRALPIAAKIEGGKVYFRRNAYWLNEFEKEILSFPNSQHDDQTDSFSYIVQLISDNSSVLPVSSKKYKKF